MEPAASQPSSYLELSANPLRDIENPRSREGLTLASNLRKRVAIVAVASLVTATTGAIIRSQCDSNKCYIASDTLIGLSVVAILVIAVGGCILRFLP
jgi:hypothetical protein